MARYCRISGKVTYWTRADASDAKRSFVRRGKAIGKVNVYLCRSCGGWHIGHHERTRLQR